MCRLYVFRSTEDTKVECTLVHAQNALMSQSRKDQSGLSHSHGWGMVTYDDGEPQAERQSWAAYHGEHFARSASRIYAKTVLAHVRRATVGEPGIENTHPFIHGHWTFAHNGTVPHFSEIQELLLSKMVPHYRQAIQGQTDSEHVFYYILSLLESSPQTSLDEVLRRTATELSEHVNAIDSKARMGLNMVLSDGNTIAGTRLGRTLYQIERTGVYDCEICGFPHIHHSPDREHRAVVVASEPITHERWEEIPERSVWFIDKQEARLSVSTL